MATVVLVAAGVGLITAESLVVTGIVADATLAVAFDTSVCKFSLPLLHSSIP